jgi:hypothetical protein
MNNSAGVLLLRKSGSAVSRILPPLRYLLRTSAAFLHSEMDNRILIDGRKVALARAPQSTVLPTLERADRPATRDVFVPAISLPKVVAKKESRTAPLASPRAQDRLIGSQGAVKLIGFEMPTSGRWKRRQSDIM